MDIKEFKAGSGADHHPWEYARLEVVYRYIKKYLPAKAQSCLDIGCGDAFVISRLARRFPTLEFHGIDTALDENLIRQYNQQINNPKVCLHREMNELPSMPEQTALVLILDVMEHTADDVKFIQEISQASQTGSNAIWLITVPAFQGLFTVRDTWLGHYRRYTRKLLKSRLQSAGMEVLSSEYFFLSLFFVRAVEKFIQFFRKPDQASMTGIGGWKAHKRMDRIMGCMLLTDFRITRLLCTLGLHLPGLSCIAVCRKQSS